MPHRGAPVPTPRVLRRPGHIAGQEIPLGLREQRVELRRQVGVVGVRMFAGAGVIAAGDGSDAAGHGGEYAPGVGV